jgi:hypothetical protein
MLKNLGANGTRRILTGLILAVALMFPHHDAVAGQAGPSSLNFNLNTAMMNTGVDLNAGGRIQWTLTRQGSTGNQRLAISLANLDPNTAYQLIAFLGDDTESTSITGFTTNQKGAFAVAYLKDSNKPPSLQTLPNALDPLCNVSEMDIVNGSMETVLRADLTNPDKGQYFVSMSNTGFIPAAVGKLRIIATPLSAQFLLQASGLTRNTDYRLTVNGNASQTYTSDISGKLVLMDLPEGSPDVFDIQMFALSDSTRENVVLAMDGLGIPCTEAAQGAVPVPLGGAANFAVLAGSTVTSSGATTVNGDLGLSPGSSVTGFPPGTVIGTQHVADPTAVQAKLDLTTAYNDAAGRTVGTVTVAGNQGGKTLTPGLYKSTSSLEISSGDLTLDAQGDPNGVFIFQIASTLTTTSGRQVILSGGAKASNVFWQVGTSATLGTTTVFKGTIMADQSITLETGATLDGRALARIAAVTLGASTVTIPAP